jgi:hypothetical protein
LYFLQQFFLPSTVPNEQAQPMVSKFCKGALSKVFVSNAANIIIYNDSKQYRKSGILKFSSFLWVSELQKENHRDNKDENNDQILPDISKKWNISVKRSNDFFHQAYISSTCV